MTKSKGMSLLELIVAVAMSSIVMVTLSTIIVSASRAYGRENNNSKVQNNAESVYNRVENALMEAQSIRLIRLVGGGFFIENDAHNVSGDGFVHTNGRAVLYTPSDGRIYMSDTTGDMIATSTSKESYLLTKSVTTFDIKLNPACIKTDEYGDTYISNPVMFDMSLSMNLRGRKTGYSRTIALRNKLKSVIYEGVTYEVR